MKRFFVKAAPAKRTAQSSTTSVPVMVLGGGVAGMAAARELANAGMYVTLVEAEDGLGGLARSFRRGNLCIPRSYHHLMDFDRKLHRILASLGLLPQLRPVEAKIGFLSHGRIYPLRTAADFCHFQPLSPWQKIQLFALALRLKALPADLAALNDLEIAAWFGTVGASLWKGWFRPFLLGKFGENPDQLSAEWLLYRLRAGETKGRFSVLEGGLQVLLDTLCRELEKTGVQVKLSTRITAISCDERKVTSLSLVQGDGSEQVHHPEAVLSTLPAPVLRQCLVGGSHDLKSKLSAIRYRASIIAIASLTHRLEGYYWVSFVEPEGPLLGYLDLATLVPGINGGNSLLYLVSYDEPDSPWTQLPSEQQAKVLSAAFLRRHPYAHIAWCQAFSFPHSKPFYAAGYRKLSLEGSELSNMFFAGTSNFPPMRNLGEAMDTGVQAAKRLLASLEKKGLPR